MRSYQAFSTSSRGTRLPESSAFGSVLGGTQSLSDTAFVSRGIVHRPLLFHIANVVISGYGIAIVMAFLIAWVVIARENERRGDEVAFAAEIVLVASIGGLAGSKLFYVAFVGNGPILSRGGHAFWGGLIGGACAYIVWARLRRVSVFYYLDIIGVAIAAGYAVGRTGCWAIGDDYGRAWNSPFAVQFPEGAPPTTAANLLNIYGQPLPSGATLTTIVAVHPTQLYETLLGLVMFLVLWHLRGHRHARGWGFGLYLVLAGVERFLIEFVRVEPDHPTLGLANAQLVALAITGVGAAFVYARASRG
jgi:phosphatidylglycerol:prolipoprotein diacylglycerol transferase